MYMCIGSKPNDKLSSHTAIYQEFFIISFMLPVNKRREKLKMLKVEAKVKHFCTLVGSFTELIAIHINFSLMFTYFT